MGVFFEFFGFHYFFGGFACYDSRVVGKLLLLPTCYTYGTYWYGTVGTVPYSLGLFYPGI